MKKKIIFTKQQLAAVEMIKTSQVSVLTGNPGTGKTTAVALIIKWAEENNLFVLNAAPTGKAAKRLQESINKEATTAHRMLGCEMVDNEFKFVHNESNKLKADLIVLDEISMITNALFADILRAIDFRRSKLLLVGDEYQLPSVQAGAVLRDLLASKKIPHVRLDIIHRNSGCLVEACHEIKNTNYYSPCKKIDLEAKNKKNIIHFEIFTPEDVLTGIETLVCNKMKSRGYDVLNDVQILSPVNIKGKLSCKSINHVMRNALNPQDEVVDIDFNGFNKGDKIINTKNFIALNTDGKEESIVNGDLGFITDTYKRQFPDGNVKEVLLIKFQDPDREIEMLAKDHTLLLAYSITTHRYQGSEAPVIIIPVHSQFDYFLSNSWIYTAISRAKDICITIGKFATIERAIKNVKPNNRVTMLKERICAADDKMMDEVFGDI